MPADLKIDVVRRLVLTRLWGVVTAADLTDGRRHMIAHPSFQPDFSQLVDLRDLISIEATSAEIQQLAAGAPFTPESKRAFVAKSDLAFGMARMYESYRESTHPGDQIRIFRNMADAELWLGLRCEHAKAG